MSDWWARKLQGDQPQVAPRGIVVQPQQPQPQYVQQPQPFQPQYMTPQEQAIAEAQRQAAQEYNDPNRQLSLREAVTRWKGGEAWRTEGGLRCPGCGSATSYTQFSGMQGMAQGVNGARPRGHCFTCGYNGQFQQGLESTWA